MRREGCRGRDAQTRGKWGGSAFTSEQGGAQLAAPLRELTRRRGYWGVYRGQPVVAVGPGAAGYGEEFFLQLTGDGAGDAFAHLDVVDGTDGCDFDGGAAEEDFVDDVQHLAGDDLFLHRDFQVFGDFHDRVAGDAGQDAGGQGRSVKRAVVDQGHVHAGTLADMAIGVERDAFGVAVEAGFHADELRIHVIGGGFGHGRKSVGRNAGPGADADIDALG